MHLLIFFENRVKGNLHPSIEISNGSLGILNPSIEIPNDAPVSPCCIQRFSEDRKKEMRFLSGRHLNFFFLLKKIHHYGSRVELLLGGGENEFELETDDGKMRLLLL